MLYREVKVFDEVILYQTAHVEGVLYMGMWYYFDVIRKSISLLWYTSTSFVEHSTTSAIRPLPELTAMDASAVDGQTVPPVTSFSLHRTNDSAFAKLHNPNSLIPDSIFCRDSTNPFFLFSHPKATTSQERR